MEILKKQNLEPNDELLISFLDLEIQQLKHLPNDELLEQIQTTRGYVIANRTFDIDNSYILKRVNQLRINE